ncbi:hypothetical protein B7494_g7215 [Chlorociboria aeruginascens]|nr:hypothetical protein B7494_g7215 [Chlorociboria aeruginascens]
MSAQNALTPRVFLFRHGETDWAKLGRSTGTTEIELKRTGAAQVSSAAAILVGPGKLLDPRRFEHIFVSPRKRARQTFNLLLGPNFGLIEGIKGKLTYTEDIAEWNYGDYEGLKNSEIRSLRQERGHDKERRWDIWTDGCEGGEHEITERLDRLISQIRVIQQPYMHGEKPADVLLVAHGLILRCFTKRWIGLSIDNPLPIMFEPGAISVLSYKNNDIDEPALHIGLALPEEDAQERTEETPTIPIEPPIVSGAYEVNEGVVKAKLLKLWAYFDRQDLWFDLLRHANSADDKWIQKLTEDELNFNEAIALLCAFGLVDPDRPPQQQVGSGRYSIHSCIHSWTLSMLNKEWDKSLARLAFTCVALEVPSTDEKDWWLLQRRLLQHATQQNIFIVNGKVDINELDWAFHKFGNFYADQGKLAKAEAMYIRAMQGYKKALGPDHISILDTVHNLGILYKKQGKLAKAEAMYIRAMQGYKKALEPDHISILNTVNNLGILYKKQGKLAEAEAMYIRAMQGYEKALGPDHISTLHTVNNLGLLYADQGKLAEAEAMYIRAIQGYEKALGPDHISILDTVHNLGLLYADQGKLAEAEAMYIRALQGNEEAFGP